MTDEELEEIERLCAAATPGPWKWDNDRMEAGYSFGPDGNYASEDDRRAGDAGTIIETDCGVYGPQPRDRVFISGARSWVPALIAEVRRMRALITKAADAATSRCSSWEFRNESWREGYIANGRMMADFLRSKIGLGQAEVPLDMTDAGIRAHEREACAKLCEEHDSGMARLGGGLYDSDRHALRLRGNELARAIRSRK